jgi:hypothetical protein
MSPDGWVPPAATPAAHARVAGDAGPGRPPGDPAATTGAEPYGTSSRAQAGADPYGVADLPWNRTHAPEPGSGVGQVDGGLPPFPGTDFVDMAATLGGPGYEGRPPRTDAVAVLALVGGLLGVLPWVGIAGIALGTWSLQRLRHNPYLAGRGLAWTGLVLGCLTVGAYVLVRLIFGSLSALLGA